MFTSESIYIIVLICLIAYYLVMGLRVLWSPVDANFLPIEQTRQRHIRRAVACYMFMWALGVVIFVPAVMRHGYDGTDAYYFQLGFMLNLCMQVPCLYWVLITLLQLKDAPWSRLAAIAVVNVAIVGWFISSQGSDQHPTPLYVMMGWVVASNVYLLIRYYRAYHLFVRQLKSLYTDLTRRDINWTWYAYGIISVQTLTYILYQFYFSIWLEALYVCFSIVTCSILVHYTLTMRPISIAMPRAEEVPDTAHPLEESSPRFQRIERQLQLVCEDAELFRNPKLTRDMLCLELGVNKNHLASYFASRGSSFYDYINHLRIDYACRLIKESVHDADFSMATISQRSGFANTVTFRTAFKAYKGCLPSDFARNIK